MAICAVEFPQNERLLIDVWPDDEEETVEFRLVYKGRVPSQGHSDVVQAKHDIRLVIHEQLKLLWREHPVLREWSESDYQGGPTHTEALADNYQRCNMRFLPLVSDKAGLACALDILFLRRDPPGSPIISGGDVDNRLKVLLDGLKMPKTCEQMPSGWKPGAGQDPLFCLLEDDGMITEIKVTSDRLLIPPAEDEHRNAVELVIHVTTKIMKPWTVSIGGMPQV
jgi:hypothetical protein